MPPPRRPATRNDSATRPPRQAPAGRRPADASDAKPRVPAGSSARPWILDPREPWLIPALAIVLTRLGLAGLVQYAAEDAYITFRYARNFAHGIGLVYNPGEHVWGFSSPLWTVWMSAAFALRAPPEAWARGTNLVIELLALWAFGDLLRRHASGAAAWCFAFFFALWPYVTAVSLSCMENTLMLALIGLASLGAERRALWAGPALGALALVRPEGVVSALVVSLCAGWRDRAIALLLAVAGFAALALYFGTPVPQSLIAKSLVYGTPGPWSGRHWWDWLSPFVFGGFTSITEGTHLFLMSVVFAPAWVLGFLRLRGALRSGLAVAIGACLAVWLGYTLLGVAYFWWYLLVPMAGFALLAAAGFPALARGPAIYVSTGLLIIGLWTIAPDLYGGRARVEYAGFARVANALRSLVKPGDKVFLEPIGMVGYQAPVRIVDEIGLVSPEVARRRAAGPGWYTDVVARERPDWLVVRNGLLVRGEAWAGVGAPFRNAAERASLLAEYQAVWSSDSFAPAQALVLLRRR